MTDHHLAMGGRSQYRKLTRQISKLEERNQALEARVERLTNERNRFQELYKAVLRRLFGRRSEKIDPDQLRFEFDQLSEEARNAVAEELGDTDPNGKDKDGTDDPKPRPSPPPAHPGRNPLPDNLERRRNVYEATAQERQCPCCQSTMAEIGEEITEELEYEPTRFFVQENVRKKYACRACDKGITRAKAPDRPIERGLPGPTLLAHVAVAKYADHLPLYRLEEIFGRAGVRITRQTMCGWVGETAELLKPIVAELKRDLLTDPLIQSDDTTVPYQGDRKGRTSKGFLWVFTRPYAEVVFDFTTNHSREGPMNFLGDYEGFLQTDGHSSYNGVYSTGKVKHIGCMAHVRRKFVEVMDTTPNDVPSDAKIIVVSIQNLYRIESEAKEQGIVGEDLVSLRRRESKPIVESLGEIFETLKGKYRPKSPMAKAIGYALGQWSSITRYIDVAEACIDNNSSEQAIKPVVIGRRNWMFAGSVAGGQRAATIYSLTVTCKRLGIDPNEYLSDVIRRVASHPNKRIGELTPRAWAKLRQN